MSRRALVALVVLAVLAMGGGVAAGLLVTRVPAPPPAAAEPTTTAAPATSQPTEEPTTSGSTSSTASSSTSTSPPELTVRAGLVQRLEDGLVVRYDASQPVSAVLVWGFGGPSGNQLQFLGPSTQGTAKLPLARTTRTVSMRVIGRAADGRQGVSGTVTSRRLVRRVVLEAASEAFSFPSVALAAGAGGSPLALRFIHEVPPQPQRTRVVNVPISYPRPGTSVTLNRDVTAIGITAHLTLRVRVTRS
jgi:hypothetical protein